MTGFEIAKLGNKTLSTSVEDIATIMNKSNGRKIVLVSPKEEIENIQSYPPVALCLIATILRENGYAVEIFDGRTDKDYLKNCLDSLTSDTVYVGLSVMSAELAEARKVSLEIRRRNKEIPIVWGGNHPTLYPLPVMRENYVDFIVHNEGAFTALELADSLVQDKRFSDINGLYYKQKEEIKFTGLKSLKEEHPARYPLIDYDFVDVDEYAENNVYSRMLNDLDSKKHRSICILTGMGCSYGCLFCINPCLKRYYRGISAEKVYEMMKYYQQKYDADGFIFIDDIFLEDIDRANRLCDLLEQGNDSFHWLRLCARGNFFAEDKLNRRLLSRIVSNGARFLQIGLESGSDRIREGFYNKGITREQILYSAKIARGLPVVVKYTSIIGAPQETIEDVFKTFYMLMKLRAINRHARYSIFHLTPEPGTVLFDRVASSSPINNETTVQDFIVIMGEQAEDTYCIKDVVENKIDPSKYLICTFYFNLFHALCKIEDATFTTKLLPSMMISLFSKLPLRIFPSLFKLLILLRFKIGTTIFPLTYWFVKYVMKYWKKSNIDEYGLAVDDGVRMGRC